MPSFARGETIRPRPRPRPRWSEKTLNSIEGQAEGWTMAMEQHARSGVDGAPQRRLHH
eukprot:COSAG06_NODE_9829_length_1808_cov_1.409011_1_plen_57_part_10